MGKPKPPPSPNFQQIATQQGTSNVDAARATARMSNPNIYTPFGSQTTEWTDESGQRPGDIPTVRMSYDPTIEKTQGLLNYAGLQSADLANEQVRKLGGVLANPFSFQAPTMNLGDFGNPGSIDPYGYARQQFRSEFGNYGNPDALMQQLTASGAAFTPNQLYEKGGMYNDPGGYGSWYVNAGETPGQALARQARESGATLGGENARLQTAPIGDIGSGHVYYQGAPTPAASLNSGTGATPTTAPMYFPPSGGGQTPGRLTPTSYTNFQEGGGQTPGRLTPTSYTNFQGGGGAPLAGQGNYVWDTNRGIDLGVPNYAMAPDESNVARMPIDAGTTAQQAIMSRLRPDQQQRRSALETQLINQGLRPGGEAYNNAARLLGQQENDESIQAGLQGLGLDLSANQQGFGQAMDRAQFGNAAAMNRQQAYNAAQQQLFNQIQQAQQFRNAAQQQAYQQALSTRELPLNEISALMSGAQVQPPGMQPWQGASVAPAPVFQAGQAQSAFDQNIYNQQMAGRNSLLGGIANLGSAGLFGLGSYLGRRTS